MTLRNSFSSSRRPVVQSFLRSRSAGVIPVTLRWANATSSRNRAWSRATITSASAS